MYHAAVIREEKGRFVSSVAPRSPRLLTIGEVGKYLRLPPARVYALIRDDLLPAVHLGRQVRVTDVALDTWIANGGKALPGGWRRKAKR